MQEELDEMVVIEDTEELDETSEEETEEEEDSLTEEEAEDEEVDVVSIDGETPPDQEEPQKAPEWVRDLRKNYRAQQEENRKLKAELERAKSVPAPSATPPQKPKLEEFDYDTEEYETALEKWHSDKLAYETREKEQAKVVEAQRKEWEDTLENYAKSKNSLKVKDFDIAEEIVTNKFSIEQQAIILQGASNPATIVYALGKSKGKIDELAKITNPVKFAFALAELQGKLKVERRNAPPPPESVVRGTANASGVDSTLERLREEAARTGDMTKVIAYKRQKKGN